MPFTVTMPKLSPTMEEGTIAKWHIKEGDHVVPGQVLVEVATDKAVLEYSALDEGYLRKILIADGSEARVNQAIAIFTETADESIEGYEPEGVPVLARAPAAEEIAEEAPPPTAAPGGLAMPAFIPEPPLKDYVFEMPTEPTLGRIPASPLARRLASEKGIDLTTIRGSGPGGRIVSEDLDKGQPSTIVAFGRQEMPKEIPGSYEEETLSPVRKAIARRLQESKTFIPHFYVTQEIDAEPMARVREELKAQGIRVTFNDFILRATALTLREHPEVNSGFDTVNNTIICFKTIDISLAVSMESGLITPIVRYADFKNLGQISTEVRNLAKRARANKLTREEYTGGSFTISNLGMFGVRDCIAVINPPQAAILAIGGIQDRPVVKDGQVVPGKVLSVTLSADHRVIDGADGARFLATLKGLLESPSALLI